MPVLNTATMDTNSRKTKERSTSQTKIVGFEPAVETSVEDQSNIYMSKIQKPQQSVERQGRSHAVKKVSKQGSNPSTEQVLQLTSNLEGRRNSANESLEVGNMCQANTSKFPVIVDEEDAVEAKLKPEKCIQEVQNIVPPPRKKVRKAHRLEDELQLEEAGPDSSLNNQKLNKVQNEMILAEQKSEIKVKAESTKAEGKPETTLQKATEMTEDKPFNVKLKKAETKKTEVTKTKMELPKLKHHEFENVPQYADTEEQSNVKLTEQILDLEKKGKEKKEQNISEQEKVMEPNKAEPSVQKKIEIGKLSLEEDSETCKLEPGIQDLRFSQKLKSDNIVIQNPEEKRGQDATEVEPVTSVVKKPLKHDNKDFDLTVKRKQSNRVEQEKSFETNETEESITQTIKMSKDQSRLVGVKKKENIEESTLETVKIDQKSDLELNEPIKDFEEKRRKLKQKQKKKQNTQDLEKVVKEPTNKEIELEYLPMKEDTNDYDESCQLEPGIKELKFSQKLKSDSILIQNTENKGTEDAGEVEPVTTVLKKPLEHDNKDFELTIKRKQPNMLEQDQDFKIHEAEDSIAQTVKISDGKSRSDQEKKTEKSQESTFETVKVGKPLNEIKDNKNNPFKKGSSDLKKNNQENDEPLFKQGLKLRKTELVKRPIEKTAIEVPKLKHHSFENIPQEVTNEQHSDIKLTKLLPELQKRKKKKPKEKEAEEGYPTESLTIEVPNEMIEPDIEEPNNKIDKPSDESLTKMKFIEEQKQLSVPLKKPVEKKPKEELSESKETAFVKNIKLKKAEVIKRPLETLVMDVPKLKHHAFESIPQEMEAEQLSNIKLSKLLPESKGKENKPKHKIPKVKKKQIEEKIDDVDVPKEKKKSDALKVINTPIEIEVIPSEETTTRKERDEIASHSAAISKKHSDIEKVEIPAYLNFHSDQGINVSEGTTEDTKNLSRSPTGIIESVQEDAEPKAPVVEKQVLTRTGKKRIEKIPEKSKETIREIPIMIEGTKTTEPMTDETVIESEVGFSFSFIPSSNLYIASSRGTQ